MCDRPVVSLFGFAGKEARGKFPVLPVVMETRTTPAFLFARCVRAIAVFFELFLDAFHKDTSSRDKGL